MEFLIIGGSKESKSKKLLAFSFDDGPNPNNILNILQILNFANVQSTFFWIVENARKLKTENPTLFNEILHLIAKGNHEIGLHAPYDYNPSLMTRLYGKFNEMELNHARNALEEITHNSISLYRPHRLLQPATIFFARRLGLKTIIGNIGSCYADAAAPAERQVNRYSQAKPGTILIFHDGISRSRQVTYITDILPRVISNLRSNGLNPTKVSNIL